MYVEAMVTLTIGNKNISNPEDFVEELRFAVMEGIAGGDWDLHQARLASIRELSDEEESVVRAAEDLFATAISTG